MKNPTGNYFCFYFKQLLPNVCGMYSFFDVFLIYSCLRNLMELLKNSTAKTKSNCLTWEIVLQRRHVMYKESKS